ncbi:MAG: TIGR01777 family oxidoreductase [Planctomycetaceae bacterium]
MRLRQSSRVVIAGGSGVLGRALARHLHQSHNVTVTLLSRNEPAEAGPWRFVKWDARSLDDWKDELDGADALVNLAGRTVDCIKTPEHKDEILRSRVESTTILGAALHQAVKPPPVWVQMSTAHIYGDPPSVVCDETSAIGTGLAPEVGLAWEHAFAKARPEGVRGVILRTSFVIGPDGGALPKLSKLTRLGLGGQVGHGRQGMSWLHQADMNLIFERSIIEDTMDGIYIATAPNPVSNAVFMRALRRAVGMPIGLPSFEWMVRIGAPLFMRTDPELALCGRYCIPRRLENEGYVFKYPELGPALADLLSAKVR